MKYIARHLCPTLILLICVSSVICAQEINADEDLEEYYEEEYDEYEYEDEYLDQDKILEGSDVDEYEDYSDYAYQVGLLIYSRPSYTRLCFNLIS